MPPWSTSDYCTALSQSTGNSSYVYALKQGDSSQYGWTSDSAFCLSQTADIWKTFLYIALVLWAFLTVVQLVHLFDPRHHHRQMMGEVIHLVIRQIIILLAACASFWLMLVVHQGIFLIADAILRRPDGNGGLHYGEVDGIWDSSHAWLALKGTQKAFQNPNWFVSFYEWVSGGSLPGDNTILTFTFTAISNGLDSIGVLLLGAVGPLRFVGMLVVLTTGPLAIVANSYHFTRRAFIRWLDAWLELEGMALVTALIFAAFTHFFLCNGDGDCGSATSTATNQGAYGMGQFEYAMLMLAFLAAINGPVIAYFWRQTGQLLDFASGSFQANYQRTRNAVDTVANIADIALSWIPVVGPIVHGLAGAERTASAVIPGGGGGSSLPDPGNRGYLNTPQWSYPNSSGDSGSSSNSDEGAASTGGGGGGGSGLVARLTPAANQNKLPGWFLRGGQPLGRASPPPRQLNPGAPEFPSGPGTLQFASFNPPSGAAGTSALPPPMAWETSGAATSSVASAAIEGGEATAIIETFGPIVAL